MTAVDFDENRGVFGFVGYFVCENSHFKDFANCHKEKHSK
jgi:hypothetical protein